MKVTRLLLTFALSFCSAYFTTAETLTVEVDATDVPRQLLKSRVTMQVESGAFTFRYPIWIPGVHSPGGPIQNMAGLRVFTQDGERLEWQRDLLNRSVFHVDIPEGAESIIVELDYILNQPSVNSKGVDSYGNAKLGVINWNTCMVYPDAVKDHSVDVQASLKLPDGWKWASALDSDAPDADIVQFQPLTLEAFMDSPLIMGEYLRTFDLESGDILGPVYLHVVSEAKGALQVPEEVITKLSNMVIESGHLFGTAHFETYDFLVVASDQVDNTGLEHLDSSFNVVGERDLLDPEDLDNTWMGGLLPHEFVHSWCGKYHRPSGMVTHDYHTLKDTQGLWIYEGLTTYLGDLLAVRSGLFSYEGFLESIASTISFFKHQSGREWRSLLDTTVSSYHLRGGSNAWSNLRRGQDYYSEGMLFWIEVDAIMRNQTDGKKSLDDFVQVFLGAKGDSGRVVAFEVDAIPDMLNEIVEYDWAPLIQKRIYDTQEKYDMSFVKECGYRLTYRDEPSEYQEDMHTRYNYVNLRESLGINVMQDGSITSSIAVGSPADKAGLAPRMKISGVNGRKFSLNHLKDAVADSVVDGKIELLVLQGDVFEEYTLEYDEGHKYLAFTRDESHPDRFKEMFAGKRKQPE